MLHNQGVIAGKLLFLRSVGCGRFIFFSDTDPSDKSLEEILELPQVDNGISYRDALIRFGTTHIPSKSRMQKKLFRRITDDTSLEEHY